jgi:hypothetical protein
MGKILYMSSIAQTNPLLTAKLEVPRRAPNTIKAEMPGRGRKKRHHLEEAYVVRCNAEFD